MIVLEDENIHKASPIEETKLKLCSRTMDANVIIRAINEACSRDALSINYIVAIFTNWKNEGVTTIESLDTFLSE